MFEWLNQIDVALFYAINVSMANPVTDFIMPIVTNDYVLRTCFGMAMVILFWRGDRRVRWSVLFALLTLAISDQTSSSLLKNMAERLRPCHVFTDIHLLVNCGGGKSMPSSHATNAFAIAAFFGIPFRRYRWPLVCIATLIALSRVFCGVHYPADIAVGAVVGAIVGTVMTRVFGYVATKFPGTDTSGESVATTKEN